MSQGQGKNLTTKIRIDNRLRIIVIRLKLQLWSPLATNISQDASRIDDFCLAVAWF